MSFQYGNETPDPRTMSREFMIQNGLLQEDEWDVVRASQEDLNVNNGMKEVLEQLQMMQQSMQHLKLQNADLEKQLKVPAQEVKASEVATWNAVPMEPPSLYQELPQQKRVVEANPKQEAFLATIYLAELELSTMLAALYCFSSIPQKQTGLREVFSNIEGESRDAYLRICKFLVASQNKHGIPLSINVQALDNSPTGEAKTEAKIEYMVNFLEELGTRYRWLLSTGLLQPMWIERRLIEIEENKLNFVLELED
jgi:hypothetical protein